MNPISSFLPQLEGKKNIVITTHPSPDADALGSSLALYHFLSGRGHSITVFTPTDYPEFLFWMPGHEVVLPYGEKTNKAITGAIQSADIIFCLDFSILRRLKETEKAVREAKAVKVLIDHHLDPEPFADFALWDTKAAATAELIYDFIIQMKGREEITPDIANCIYAGIMTDTGSFKHPSTSAKVHRTVADLIDLGANVNHVAREIYDTNSVNRLRFLGYALLEKLVVRHDLNIAYFVIGAEEFERFGLKNGDTEGLVNYALSIKGIVMATIIIERSEEVKLSFRSVGDFAVNKFANDHFSGGGHKNASGGSSPQSLSQTVTKFESLIGDFQSKYLIKDK
jgi:phosphoesterase RecJ-like protein